MSDEDAEIPATEAPEQPEPGPGYWPDEWRRHIERAEQNLAASPPPTIPAPEPEPTPEPKASPFDPGEHTVAEVEEYVDAHPDERGRVLDAERAGKDRVTLVDWLGTDAG